MSSIQPRETGCICSQDKSNLNRESINKHCQHGCGNNGPYYPLYGMIITGMLAPILIALWYKDSV